MIEQPTCPKCKSLMVKQVGFSRMAIESIESITDGVKMSINPGERETRYYRCLSCRHQFDVSGVGGWEPRR